MRPLLLVVLLFLHTLAADAAARLPLSHRSNMAQRPLNDSQTASTSHIWKLSLLGLAGLSFLIRKRL